MKVSPWRASLCKPFICLVGILLLTAIPAIADNISLIPAASGPLVGAAHTYTGTTTSITANGWYYTGTNALNNGSWSQSGVVLWGRNETPNEMGVGICSPNENSPTPNCGTSPYSGHGDYNEISNNVNPEVMVLSKQANFLWTSVQLSSLDNNGGTIPERGSIYASNSASPSNGNFGTLICNFVAGGDNVAADHPCFTTANSSAQPIISLSGYASSSYIVLRAYDWTGGGSTNNDFLAEAVTVNAVPEPSSIVFFFTAALGFAKVGRRKLLS